MEFRRRRRRRRSFAQADGGGTGRAILALLLIAAVVYVVSASAAGTWIAQNVVAPVFSAVDGWVQGASVKSTPPAPGKTPPPEPGGTVQAPTLTEEVEVPAMQCFALQLGVYGDKNNADTQAAALQKRGAGGYIMEDAGRYRVLAAGYQDRSSLDQVREQLLSEGLESALYQFPSPVSTLRVTATEAQLARIKDGLSALSRLQDALASASLAFDKEQQSVQIGSEKAQALLDELKSAQEAFLSGDTAGNTVLAAMAECFSGYQDALSELSAYKTQSFVDFSSKMKYTHLSIAHAYATLAQQVSAMS